MLPLIDSPVGQRHRAGLDNRTGAFREWLADGKVMEPAGLHQPEHGGIKPGRPRGVRLLALSPRWPPLTIVSVALTGTAGLAESALLGGAA